MTTSGLTGFSLTRNEIIRLALLRCNGLEFDENEVGTQQQKHASDELNLIIQRLSSKKPIFGTIDYEIPLYDSKQSYTLNPSGNKNIPIPMAITSGRRRSSSDQDTPIEKISRRDYMDLPSKSSTGYANVFAYDKQLTEGVLYVWPVSSTSSTSLSDGSTNYWTNSGTVPGEYYYTGTAISSEPYYVFANGTELTEGTLGSLSNGEYAWGDNDALGSDTLYVKTSLGDPDAQASGYIKVLASMPDRLVVTAHRQLEYFSASSDTPDLPPETFEMLVANLAASLSVQYAPQRYAILKQEAINLYNEYMSDDNDSVGFKIEPRFK